LNGYSGHASPQPIVTTTSAARHLVLPGRARRRRPQGTGAGGAPDGSRHALYRGG
jgi:hypothetical protein